MAGWHTRAIIYQIDTALFYDLNGDGCGDIAGIAAKLRYIRRMGATVIWITPFYLTPFLDEGYDVSDHLQVDPRFGKLNDIIAFIEQARELGMQVIIELLIQHTSFFFCVSNLKLCKDHTQFSLIQCCTVLRCQ